MKTQDKQLRHIEKRIEALKAKLLVIGEMRPGSLSLQYNVCGNPTCRCKHKDDPKKHGPYYQLSYVHKGKSSSQFIRKEFLAETKKQIVNYQRFKKLSEEWIELALTHAKIKLDIGRESG